MTPALVIDRPGLLTSVQDFGRVGYQSSGVPVSGALDPVAMRLANFLVGNREDEAVIEVLVQGPAMTVDAGSVRIALAGGGAGIELLGDGGVTVPTLTSVRLERGRSFRVTPLAGSNVACLAVEGGLAIDPVMGSRSTFMRGGFGGFAGRALMPGDRLPLSSATAEPRAERSLRYDLPRPDRIRVVAGPQDDAFTREGMEAFLSSPFIISPASDRMGLRLDGPPLAHRKSADIVSDGMAPGSVQVPASGQPIVLLADRGTTGGYTKIATVISADLPAIARRRVGETVRFESVSRETAVAARRELEAELARVVASAMTLPEGGGIPTQDTLLSLYTANLVSGVVDAQE
ncbi:MAG: biotin-dependent carboxyltransferase family protein [Pseudomonadota bacterium]|nr:biotin-dependent carboxyltransferase family protein [Pseudomonadota bacterium]